MTVRRCEDILIYSGDGCFHKRIRVLLAGLGCTALEAFDIEEAAAMLLGNRFTVTVFDPFYSERGAAETLGRFFGSEDRSVICLGDADGLPEHTAALSRRASEREFMSAFLLERYRLRMIMLREDPRGFGGEPLIRSCVGESFERLGINGGGIGREYLAEAVYLAVCDTTLAERIDRALFERVGEAVGAGKTGVGHMIRYTIRSLWQSPEPMPFMRRYLCGGAASARVIDTGSFIRRLSADIRRSLGIITVNTM